MKKQYLIYALFALTLAEFALVSCSKEPAPPVSQNCESKQCVATTQSGSRCSRNTTYCNQRCWQHQ